LVRCIGVAVADLYSQGWLLPAWCRDVLVIAGLHALKKRTVWATLWELFPGQSPYRVGSATGRWPWGMAPIRIFFLAFRTSRIALITVRLRGAGILIFGVDPEGKRTFRQIVFTAALSSGRVLPAAWVCGICISGAWCQRGASAGMPVAFCAKNPMSVLSVDASYRHAIRWFLVWSRKFALNKAFAFIREDQDAKCFQAALTHL